MKKSLEKLDFAHQIRPLKSLLRYSNNDLVLTKDTVGSHSWRAASLALIYQKEFNAEGIDINKVIQMLLIHDLVELGNDEVKALGHRNKKAKESLEFSRAKSLLRGYQSKDLQSIQALLGEFLDQKTIDARLAKALENYESNMHVIEEKTPILDKQHRELTINYISRRIGISSTMDQLIEDQLTEITNIANNN